MIVQATLCEIIHGGRLLLQRKSAGRFGEGKWNGPGGKVKPGETPLECVIREVREETGLTVSRLTEQGVVDFYFGEKQEPDWVVHIYATSSFKGEPKESDEGELKWFGVDEIPYTDAQYRVLTETTLEIMHRFPRISLDRIAGHDEIAPGRKTDPGASFDWQRYRGALSAHLADA